MSDEYDTVHTMTDYYDGPRRGIADVSGRPHVYTSTWADIDTDEEEDVFELHAIDAETLSLALESWAIWLRWEEAFHDGQTNLHTHPALPEDRALRRPRRATVRAGTVSSAHHSLPVTASMNSTPPPNRKSISTSATSEMPVTFQPDSCFPPARR